MHQLTPSKTFAEFFAGIGLVHEALRKSGWRCTYANDIDAKKEAMYRGHFGASDYLHRADIWDTASVIERIVNSPFLATASFPCTDLSLAGHWQGFEGSQSSTYFGFIRVIESLCTRRPKVILLENVSGFLTSKGGADFERAVGALATQGYWIDSFVLDARSFVPQSRPRVFVVGYHHRSLKSDQLIHQNSSSFLADPWLEAINRSGSLRPESLKRLMCRSGLQTGWATLALRPPRQTKYTLSSLIDTDAEQQWWDAATTKKHYAMLSDLHRREVERRAASGGIHVGTGFRRCRNDEMRAELRFDNCAGCLRTPRGGSARQMVVVIENGATRFRWMTPREYARLQGAPRFKLVPNEIQSMFGFGDGVCVPVIRWIDANVLTPLFDEYAGRIEPGRKREVRTRTSTNSRRAVA